MKMPDPDRLESLPPTRPVNPAPRESASESLGLLVWLAELARSIQDDESQTGDGLEKIPKAIGPFILESLLGAGAYGAVFRAFDSELERWVALKVAWPHVMFDAVASRRFVEEPRAAASLSHPGILKVHKSGSSESISYIALELIEGPTLGEWFKQQPQVAFRLAAQIVQKVAEAIHFAHEHGVIHRDLKPGNILLRGCEDSEFLYQPVVGDFGLARRARLTVASSLTATHDILGSDPYISPEQLQSIKDVGPASDVYSLGVILYELIAGRRPFVGANSEQTRWQVLNDEPPSMRIFRPGVPRDLETIALKCLEKSPEQRYASAQDLANDLQNYVVGAPIRGRRAGALQRVWRYAQRKPLVVSLIFSVLIGGMLVAGLTGAWIADRISAADRIVAAEAATAVAEGVERQHQYNSAIRHAADSDNRHSRGTALEFLDHAEQLASPPVLRGIEWDFLSSKLSNFDLTIDASQYAIQTLRFSRATALLLSVDAKGRVVAWDTTTWKARFQLDSGIGDVSVAETSPDGSLLALSGDPARLLVYRMSDRNKIYDEPALGGRILAAAWLGNGDRLATVGEDAVVRVVHLSSGQQSASAALIGEKSTEPRVRLDMASLQYLPTHDAIAVATHPGGFQELDAKTLAVSDSLVGESSGIPPCYYLGPQHDALIVQNGSTLHVLNVTASTVVRTIELNAYVRAMCADPAGLSLALSLHDGTVAVWNVADLVEGLDPRRKHFSAHSGRTTTVDFSGDGKWLASGGDDGQIRLWQRAAIEELPDLELAKQPWHPTFSPCGRWLTVVTGPRGQPGQVIVFDVHTGQRLWQSAAASAEDVAATREIFWLPVEQAAFAPNGDEVIVLDPDFSLHGHDPLSGKRLRSYRTSASAANPPRWFQVTPDGRTIVIWLMKAVELIDRASGIPIVQHPAFQTRELGYFNTRLGSLWLEGDPDELKFRLLPSRDGKPVLTLPSFADAAHAPTTSADGRYLAIGGLDGTAYVWDLANPQLPIQCIGHETFCIEIAFAPDGRTLVTHAYQAEKEGSVRFWHLPSGEQLLKLGSTEQPVLCMGLSPLGNAMALGIERNGGYRLQILRFGSRKGAPRATR